MSVREILSKKLAQHFRKRGYKIEWGPFLTTVEGPGRFYRVFGFSVPRLVAGEVQVWNPKFIAVRWNAGNGLESVKYDSAKDVKQWANRSEWV